MPVPNVTAYGGSGFARTDKKLPAITLRPRTLPVWRIYKTSRTLSHPPGAGAEGIPFHIATAALFVPHYTPSKKQLQKYRTKKPGKPKVENMAIIHTSITATLPGVLPVRVRTWAANPHAAHVLHILKRHINSGVNAAHVFTFAGN